MERRTVAKFRRASEDCKAASCPALIALIDRRGKHTALLWTSMCSGGVKFTNCPFGRAEQRGDGQQSLVVVVQGPALITLYIGH